MVEPGTKKAQDRTLTVYKERDRPVYEVLTSHCPNIEPRLLNCLIEAVFCRVEEVQYHALTQLDTTATELMRDYQPFEITAALTLVADLLSGHQHGGIGLPLGYFGVFVVRMHDDKLAVLGVQNTQGKPDTWKIRLYSAEAIFGRGARVFWLP